MQQNFSMTQNALKADRNCFINKLAAQPEPDPPTGYVYLMKCGQPCKIGSTNDLKRRQRELNQASSDHVELIAYIPTDDPPVELERSLQERFRQYQVKGEWFELPGAVVEFFVAMRGCVATEKYKAWWE